MSKASASRHQHEALSAGHRACQALDRQAPGSHQHLLNSDYIIKYGYVNDIFICRQRNLNAANLNALNNIFPLRTDISLVFLEK